MAWRAELALDYRHTDGRTVVQPRHQGPLRVLHSLYPEGPGICHNVLVHPPGGLTGGDHLSVSAHVGAGAHALISTPGATRFYRSEGELAEQHVHLSLEAGARLEWLPLETLAYPACRAVNRLRFELAEGSELMAWDVCSLGLPASGDRFESGRLDTSMHWPGVWLEQARLDADDTRLRHSPLGLHGQRALATLVLACGTAWSHARREGLLDAMRAVLADSPLADCCGVSAPNDRLIVARAMAPLIEAPMQLWQALWALLRREAWGLDSVAPRVWRV